MRKIYIVLFILMALLPERSISAVSDTTLQVFATFPVGTYLTQKYTDDTLYLKRAIEEFGSITTGTMKMKTIRPSQNQYDFSGSDYWVDFAEQHAKRVHGHVLIWGSVPDWLLNFNGDSLAWENLMKDHIQTIVTRYKGRVSSWDVVNEAIGDDGNVKSDNIWCQHLGEGYIERAYIYAHEADSNALLFYNDYGHEYSDTRLNAIVSMLNDFVARGIPVHGIGMQMHTRYNLGDYRWKNAIKQAASTGLKVHISELDISLNPAMDTSVVYSPELAQEQKDKYRYIVQAYKALPNEQKFGITTWGVGDQDSWKRIAWPLLFDESYQRKPAYYGVLEGFRQAGQTSLFFTEATSGYPTKYSFQSGDALYLSQGRNTSTSGVCPGKDGVARNYRIQEHTFVVELHSTSMDSISIYGRGSSSMSRNICKVEISGESKDGPYTDITNNVRVGSPMATTSCGSNLTVADINAPIGSYVRFKIALISDSITSAPVNISEIFIAPIPVSLYFNQATTGYPTKYTLNTGDAIYLSHGRNTSSSGVCPGRNGMGRDYRVQEHTFILEIKSTSVDSLSIYGKGSSSLPRNISKVEFSSESKDGTFTDITSSVNIGPSMATTNCGSNLTVSNLRAPIGSFLKFTTTLVSDESTPATVNISELLLYPIASPNTIPRMNIRNENSNFEDQLNSVSGEIFPEISKSIKLIRYYTIMGVETNQYSEGFMIEKIIYEDGSTVSNKIFNKVRN